MAAVGPGPSVATAAAIGPDAALIPPAVHVHGEREGPTLRYAAFAAAAIGDDPATGHPAF